MPTPKLALILALALASTAPGLAGAEPRSPERARLDELSRRLTDRRAELATAVTLEQIWAAWDQVGAGPVIAALEVAADRPDLNPSVRGGARWYLAEAALRQGQIDEARRRADELGVVRSFLVLGPLDNDGEGGFDRPTPAEQQLGEPLELERPIEGLGRQVSWREVEVEAPLGELRFDGIVHPAVPICALAASSVELTRPTTVTLRFGAGGASVIWLDGVELDRDGAYRQLHGGRLAARAQLSAGIHRVLIKVCGLESPPALSLRVVSQDGEPLGGGLSASAPLAGQATATLRRGAVRWLPTPFQRSEAVAQRPGGRREQQLAAARWLALTDSDDPGELMAPDLAAAAAGDPAEGPLELEAQLLAARLALDRNAARQRLEAVLERRPAEVEALVALGELLLDGPCPQEALPVARRAAREAPLSVGAAALRARLYERMGLPRSALATVRRRLEPLDPDPPALLQQGARLADAAQMTDLARALGRALVAQRFDLTSAHWALAELARDRLEPAAAAAHLEAIEQVGWADLDQRVNAAGLYDQIGRQTEAEAALRRLTTQAPTAPEPWAALGRLLAGAGRRAEAVPLLERSLELHPQDQQTRELITYLRAEAPMEDEFMEPPEVFLARRGGEGGQHARWLLDLTVVQVHPSGLSSRFRQIVVEILDERGARQARAHAISFVPEEQRVTLRRARVLHADGSIEEAAGRYIQHLSEPQIRMYYDERAEVIELPRLRPGDVVEYAYRVDDVAARNMFGDAFGDLVLFQGEEPRQRVAYVLIHPVGRQIVAEAPALDSVRHQRRCDPDPGGHCVQSWEATEVAGLRPEEDQPPLVELGARLSISTWESWDEVGRWWWALVRDQLVPDDSLRRIVEELTEGVESPAERVRAIHRWVIERTRYVALEFGIHGYQPYRVTQVVDRGFGDCKDKAALLVTMLELAGVDASMVLLRTRLSGRVPPRPPGLTLFDHAIAYVPELDLFLDGTAEQSGTTELPWMDQGVSALIVAGDGSSRLVTTPIDEPDENLSRLEVRMTLPGADAPPLLEVLEQISGAEAAQLRFHFQAPALRRERLEARMTRGWPGARLLGHRFLEISDREQPVELEARLEAPSTSQERGGRLRVELSRPRELSRRWARRSERQTPLELRTPPHTTLEERVVELPPGASVAELPPPVSITSPFGSLESSSRLDGREVRATTRLVVTTDRIEPTEYGEFRQFCRQVDRALERRLVVELE